MIKTRVRLDKHKSFDDWDTMLMGIVLILKCEELGGDDSFMAWCASVTVTSVSVMACSPIHLEASVRLASPSPPPDIEWMAAALPAFHRGNARADLISSSIR